MSRPAQNSLKTWRENQLLTVSELAARVPVARQTWYSWERGDSIPPKGLMVRVVELTAGAVQPSDFYRLPVHLRREAA